MRYPFFPLRRHRIFAPTSFALVLLCLPPGLASAQSMANMPGMMPIPAPDQLPVPIKMTGIGNSHIAIKATPEAQVWFDQGLSLLHDFWDYESEKAFEQSIRVDPNCAMCYWGLAQAIAMRGDEESRSYVKQAMAQAERLKSHAPATEKLYIDAGPGDFRPRSNGANPSIPILRKLVQKAPHDIEARIFLAGAVGDGYDDKGEPRAGQKERISILEGILREAPNDSAANHYWIHAIEPSNHPERAIPSAALLASLAPTSGHMVHMPGHIYYRVGDYAQAEHWFAASITADETYMRDQHISVDDDWNYVHNMMYAIANLMEQGKLAQANALSDHLGAARGQLSATLYIWSARDQMSRIARRLPVALRTADWDTVLALLAQSSLGDGDKTANLRFLSSELTDFAAGMRALESNDIASAELASDHMDAGLWRMQRDVDAKDEAKKKSDDAQAGATSSQDTAPAAKSDKPPILPVMPDADAGPLLKNLGIASLELRAGLLAAQGKLDAAKKMYASAIAEEKKAGYHEPPFYIRPVGENEAAALLRAHDYPGAKAAYESALDERPNSGFGLYGLARVLELSGDAASARESYRTFLKAWATADPSLPEIVHAHEMVDQPVVAAR
jgi:tetratricopeptide (TPR) repeat protein